MQQENAKMLDGFIDRPTLARELNISMRTVNAYEDRGMPVIKIGQRRCLYRREDVMAWLMSHSSGRVAQ